MIRLNNYIITPTIFPDKTSQVWKLPDNLIEDYNTIIWDFENEAELIHVAQLTDLMVGKHVFLDIPYFPYARQDKHVSNYGTFALRTFCKLLDTLNVNYIKTFDLHSNVAKQILETPLIIESAKQRILQTIRTVNPEVIVFPDYGAQTRYENITTNIAVVSCRKERNQLTGEITGLTTSNDDAFKLKDTSVLIVDDLCDGGGTFINISKYIKSLNTSVEINLYTSHGLYTKGIQVLKDSGINRIFNRNGEIK